RLSQAGDEAGANRITHCRRDYWDYRGRLLCCDGGWRSPCDNGVDLELDEFGCDLCETLIAPLRPANLDRDGAVLDPAEFAQSAHKSSNTLAFGRSRGCALESDGRQLRRLLRAPRAA